MAASVDYPTGLRPMIHPGTSREVPAVFTQNRSADGKMYTQSIHDDPPYVYSFTLKFTDQEALYFWAWFNDADYCDKGRAEFNFPVQMDGGYKMDQVCKFTADGVPQLVSINGGVKSYSAKVYIQDFDAGVTTAEIIEIFDVFGLDDPNLFDVIDIAVNVSYP